MFRRDYLLKQLEQLVGLFRRMMQLKSEQKYEAAFAEADTIYDQVFAAHKQLIKYADSATLATIIGEAELVHAIARVTRVEGEIYEAQGDKDMAAQRYKRALELHLEAGARDAAKDVEELTKRVDPATLEARYKSRLP